MGNPLTYNGYAMTWDGRQLMEMSMTGGQFRYTFTYNDEGLRTSKTAGGYTHKYVWEGSTLVSESWGNHLLIYLYDESGSPIGLQYRSTAYAEGVFDTYYFEKNLFGDITAVYNAAGSKLGSYTYDAWGNCTVSVEPNTTAADKRVVRNYNSFRYRGYYYDTETGLYYLQSRYYNPAWGRFLNADGYVNANGDLIGFNMYAYCSNNPVMNVDPTGKGILPDTLAAVLCTPIGGIAYQVDVFAFCYLGMAIASIWNKDIRNDMNAIGWNPFNSDTKLVASSNVVSFYNGVPVFRTDDTMSGSFGIIVLSRHGFENEDGFCWTPEENVKHEWGHNVQQAIYGPIPYLLNIGLPSVLMNGDNEPWEITADILGGVNREHDAGDVKRGWDYFGWGRFVGPQWWW